MDGVSLDRSKETALASVERAGCAAGLPKQAKSLSWVQRYPQDLHGACFSSTAKGGSYGGLAARGTPFLYALRAAA